MSATANKHMALPSDAWLSGSTGMPALHAAQLAVANTVIEGGIVLPETEDALRKWASGEITDEQLLDFGRLTFGTPR
jgi:hypothetical protein